LKNILVLIFVCTFFIACSSKEVKTINHNSQQENAKDALKDL
jgi:hypothetical protein